MTNGTPEPGAHIDKLYDAIEFVKADRAEDARRLLRELIREDGDFEDAWLWMSVAVDSLDQSSICLDNVLRINPANGEAAAALYRIRIPEMEMQRRRSTLRTGRDFSLMFMWILCAACMFGVFVTYFSRA